MASIILPGTATPAQVLTGQTFSAGSNFNAAGTMPNQGSPSWVPGPSGILLPAGYYSGGTIQGDANLAAANIIAGKSIFGITGSAPNVASNGGSVLYFFGEGITTWTNTTLSGSVSWNNGGYYLNYNNNSTSGQQALYCPNAMIDVTGWKYVVAFFHDMFDNFSFCVSKTNGDTSNSAGTQNATTNIGPTDAGPNYSQLFYADISALSGQYYIKLLATNSGTSYGGGRCYAIVLMNNVY